MARRPADDDTVSMVRRALVALLVAGAAVVGLAAPAAANHVVDWGAGTACGATSKTATTTQNGRVSFIACVTLGGEPLPGHTMQLQIVGPTRSVEANVTTGDDGVTRWSVQPTAPGDTRVTLCDADGCLYGSTVITATPASTPTTAAPPPPPPTTAVAAPTTTTTVIVAGPPAAETTVTSATTSTTTTTTTTSTTTAQDDEDDDDGVPAWLIALGTAVLVLVALFTWLRSRVTGLIGGGVVTDDGGTPIASRPREPSGLRPVIFVPGVMASALRIRRGDGTFEQVWPPLGFDGNPRLCLESLVTQPATSFEIDTATGDGLLDNIHSKVIRTLNGHGYQNGGPKPNLYISPYNWMRSCEDAGADLAALVARANAEHGLPPSIVCHSMGGLVTRAAWHLHGARDIDRVVYIGSPHLGASMAYFVLHPSIPYQFLPGLGGAVLNAAYAIRTVTTAEGHVSSPVAEFSAFVQLALGGSDAFDSVLKRVALNAGGVFELLPDEKYFEHVHPRWPLATAMGVRHRKVDHRVETTTFEDAPVPVHGNPTTWQALYLEDRDLRLPTNLHPRVRAAMDFKRRISGPLPPGDGGRTMIIYGRRQPTNSSAELFVTDDDIDVTFTGEQGGDGTVPTESGRGQPLWVGEPRVEMENSCEHFMLTEAPNVARLLREFLPPGGA
jgi:hypothetical protein